MRRPETSPLRLVREVPPEAPPPDPKDLDQVFRRYAPYVARVAGRILGQSHEIEDLVQDVFLEAHRGLEALRDPGAVRYWLATVTVRKARRRLARRRMWRWVGLESPIDPDLTPDDRPSPETRASVVAVYRILDALPADARIAWILHRVEGEPLEKIAEVCGCSRATAHRRLKEAQDALEKGLGHASAG